MIASAKECDWIDLAKLPGELPHRMIRSVFSDAEGRSQIRLLNPPCAAQLGNFQQRDIIDANQSRVEDSFLLT